MHGPNDEFEIKTKSTAIVGFGFCGRLAFVHLVKKSTKNKILIFDPSLAKTLGPAFSYFSSHYILNVPAINMSAFSDAPRDFCNFLEKNYPQIFSEIGENGYAPRHIYGEYLDQLTHQAFLEAKEKNVNFEIVAQEVSEILSQGEGFLINQKFVADEVFLASSFKQSDLPANLNLLNVEVISSLWGDEFKKFHQENFNNQTICLIGSGLSAVDVIVGLKKRNFSGKIFVNSRRGNFPKKHFAEIQPSLNFISASDAKNGVLFLCLKIRNFLKQNPQFDLRHVIDSIRKITPALWQNLDEKNKKQFLRLLPYWNIFRHRAPISSIELIEEIIESGQLKIVKKGQKTLDYDLLVNCLGFEFRAEKYPLFSQMISKDLLKKDLFLMNSNHPRIHLLGGLNIARDFECTAAPDLRTSVENMLN
jgi:uncharacterized NAD(P)/FAD-binding protein YdhS